VRDYVHVGDLADAHVAAATALAEDRPLAPVYNCGSGKGMSVAELMAAVQRATGNDFSPEVLPRRAGDPPRIVADGAAAARDLGWRMSHSVDEMVLSAWRAWLSAAATSRPRPA
jgi:UDP-glucose 4-epimerase